MRLLFFTILICLKLTIVAQDKMAPGIISTLNFGEYGLTFLTDSTICFTRFIDGPTLMISEFNNGQWTEPTKAPFSGEFGGEYPRFNPSTNQLFFASKRPSKADEIKQSNDIWVVQLTDHEWTDAVHLDNNFSTPGIDSGADSFGNEIYFHSDRNGGGGINDVDIFCIPSGNPKDSAEYLSISSTLVDGEPFIFDNGNAMLFMSAGHGSIGNSDIFLSLKKDEEWQKPSPIDTLGLVNTFQWEYSPTLSNDMKTLYFTRYTQEGLADIYQIEVNKLSNKDLREIATRKHN